jgi:hypothetical protein
MVEQSRPAGRCARAWRRSGVTQIAASRAQHIGVARLAPSGSRADVAVRAIAARWEPAEGQSPLHRLRELGPSVHALRVDFPPVGG